MPKSTRLLILLSALLFIPNVWASAQATQGQSPAPGAAAEEKQSASAADLVNAAADGKEELVEQYLEAGVDVNARDEYGQTALFGATVGRHYDLALTLLDRGADPNLARDTGRTPLLAAIKRGFDTNFYRREPESQKLLAALLEKGADVNARDEDGVTPLEEAARIGDADTIRALVARGANLGTKNNEGETPLHVAARELRGYAVRALIDAGAPLTAGQKIQYFGYKVARAEGWILPFLIVFSFLVGYFGKKLTRPEPKRRAVSSGDDLPHLAPLKCAQCGAGVPLNHEEMKCPRCDTPVPVPEDYGETIRLRAKVAEKMGRAVAAWRRANLFTVWPLRVLLWLLAPVILVVTAFGTFSKLGDSLFAVDTKNAFLGLFAVLGGLSLAVALWAYASYLSGTRKRLPAIPVTGQKVGEAEVTNCRLCGGGISYEAGDLAAICAYCGGETYRIRLTRRARAVAAEEKEQAALSLYDAMSEIVERRQKAFKYLYKTALVVFSLALAILLYVV